jgi:hypothetical protein
MRPCLRCGTTEGVELESSRTMYPTEPPTWLERVADIETDPNAPIPLCRECAEEHHDHWNGMWAEYYAGLM